MAGIKTLRRQAEARNAAALAAANSYNRPAVNYGDQNWAGTGMGAVPVVASGNPVAAAVADGPVSSETTKGKSGKTLAKRNKDETIKKVLIVGGVVVGAILLIRIFKPRPKTFTQKVHDAIAKVF